MARKQITLILPDHVHEYILHKLAIYNDKSYPSLVRDFLTAYCEDAMQREAKASPRAQLSEAEQRRRDIEAQNKLIKAEKLNKKLTAVEFKLPAGFRLLRDDNNYPSVQHIESGITVDIYSTSSKEKERAVNEILAQLSAQSAEPAASDLPEGWHWGVDDEGDRCLITPRGNQGYLTEGVSLETLVAQLKEYEQPRKASGMSAGLRVTLASILDKGRSDD